MSPTYFGSLPSDACVLGTEQATPVDYGPDRIAVTGYDAVGRVSTLTSAYGTGAQSDDVHYSYTANGKVESVLDGESNKTTFVYDGFDRVYQAQLPSTTKGAGTSNSSDYEQYTYDENGNVVTRRQRDGTSIAFAYDALNRVTTRDLPGTEPDTTFTWDLLGALTGATQGTEAVTFTYDALGRKLTETGLLGTMTSQWDAAGRRTQLTWPDGTYLNYDYLVTGEVSAVRQNGATSGINVLATYVYDDLGRRTSLARGNGTSSSYGYDAVSRLTSLGHDLSDTSWDQTIGLTYNPAGQIVTHSFSNDAYAYTGMGSGTKSYAINGLNQVTAVGSTAVTSDGRGNLLSDGTNSYGFSSDNRVTSLITGSITTALGYDALGRWIKGGTSIAFLWDGDDMVIERLSGAAAKWVHGADGEPLIREDPDGTWHWVYLDERRSTIATALNDGTKEWVTTYDDYGRTGPGHGPFRYGYAGQVGIGSGLSFARNRVYALNLGRFLQTDPIGYGDGLNWYNYVHSDPVNSTDPLGLGVCIGGYDSAGNCALILVTGSRGAGTRSGHDGASRLQLRMPVTDGGGDGSTPPQPKQPQNTFDCNDAVKESGKIATKVLSVSAVGGIGWVAAGGTWTNLSTGTHGTFVSFGFGAGLQGGGTLTLPRYTSLSAFVGMSDGFSIGLSLPIGPVAVGGSYVRSWNESGSGGGDAIDASSPGLPFLGGAATYSDTKISNCKRRSS